jgi:Sulfatase
VILVILDTLRADYSQELNRLVDFGFVPQESVLAPSSWTVPSHASAFTGLLPSQHGIDGYNEDQIREASSKLGEMSENIMKGLSSDGYETYGFTCNPAIGPKYGYPFGEFRLFDQDGDLEMLREILRPNRSRIEKEFLLFKDRKFSYLINRALRRTHIEAPVRRMFRSYPIEKGSRFCLEAIRCADFHKPAFIFVNLMEAHEPYAWNDLKGNWEMYARDYILGIPSTTLAHWQLRYPIHADFAENRLLKLVEIMKPLWRDSLIIVASDHGQLLGEGGRFGHGYYLDDELLKVPFYMRVPDGKRQPERQGDFLNLTSVPDIIKSVLGWSDVKLGSRITVSESLGPTRIGGKLRKLVRSADEEEKFTKAFAHRLRVFSRKGSTIFNVSTGEVEESKGVVSKADISEAFETFTIKKFEVSHPSSSVQSYAHQVVNSDEDLITKRLKDLGYE